MLPELKTIFESIDSEILSEAVREEISNLIDEKIKEKVDARLTLELESAIATIDEDHATKFQSALDTIDEDHTNKVKAVVEFLNEDHGKKLLFIENKYKTALQKTAVEHRDSIVEAVNLFLDDEVIEKRFPKVQVIEAAKNNHVASLLNEARQVLGVDKTFISKNLKEGILDGKKQMDKLIKENSELKQKTLVTESQKVLAEKTANLPPTVARFVRSRLTNKTPKFIEENFSYVMEMYERNEKSEKRSALNDNKPQIDRSKVVGEIIKEQTQVLNNTVPTNALESMYLEAMEYRK